MSHRDEFGQWDPKNQRPELWGLYNTRHHRGEHVRVFPLSNWTELDIWRFIAERDVELPSLYFAHHREVFRRDGMLMAVNRHVRAARRRGAVRGDGALPHDRRRHVHGRRRVDGVHRRRHRRRDERSPGSPSAAPPAPTTGSPRPAWKTASARATSEMAAPRSRPPAAQRGTVALRHGRQRRRRQVDADRPAAARLEVDLRGPARAHRGGQQAPRQRLRRPRPADRRPARRARAGHHDRRRLPLLLDAAPRLRHRRLPWPRAVHAQHDHRRVRRRPGDRARRRPPRRRRADPAPQPARVAARRAAPRHRRQQDGPRRATTEDRFDEIVARSSPSSPPASTCTTSRSSRSRRSTATTSSSARRTWRGTRDRRCCTTSRPCTTAERRQLIDVRFPVQYVDPPAARRAPRLPRATPARSPPARCGPATRCVVLPSGRARRAIARIDTADGPVDEAAPVDGRHRACWPTTSTSRAAT